MNEAKLRQYVVDIAMRDLGAKQYSAKHANIIRDFNKIPGMGSWMTTDYAWCAATVSVWGFRAGLGKIYYPSASCNTMISLYKKHNRWIENDAYVPKPGDLVMYDWNALAYGDCKGEADHVGLVMSVSGSYIRAIEGNRNNAVATREFKIDWRYIRGFCVPDFKSVATQDVKPTKNWRKLLQTALNVNYDLNLAIDGSIGPLSKQAIDHHYLWYVKQNPKKGAHVSWLQEALKALGYDIKVDGSFGPKTEATLKQFQKDKGIDVDGYAGIQTHLTLLKALDNLA